MMKTQFLWLLMGVCNKFRTLQHAVMGSSCLLKRIGVTVWLAFAVWSVAAQTCQIAYTYEMRTLPTLMEQYLTLQNVQHLRLTLKGDFFGKRAKLKKVSCRQGVFTEQTLLSDMIHFILTDSVETLDFMAIPYGSDSLRVTCFYPDCYNRALFNDTVWTDSSKILMETYTSGKGPDIPLIACTSGIAIEGGIWYCGLRDSGVAPRNWYDKYQIHNYDYYTILIEEDTPPNSDMPFYMQISKLKEEGAQ